MLARRRLLGLIAGAALAAALVGCGAAEPGTDAHATATPDAASHGAEAHEEAATVKDAKAQEAPAKDAANDAHGKDAATKEGAAKETAPKEAAKDAHGKDAATKDAAARDAAARDGAAKDTAKDPHAKDAAKEAPGAPAAADHGELQPSFGPTYVIKDRIVNLADPATRRYLRFSAAIEFAPHETAKASQAPSQREASTHLVVYTPEHDGYQPVTGGKNEADKLFQSQVKRYVPAMEDTVLTLLSSKTYAEVATADRRESTKRELRSRLASLLDGTDLHVTNVYFTDFVVQ
jgi:hypothetical protein